MHNEQFNNVFRSEGGGTGERKEKERVVEDIRNRSSHRSGGGGTERNKGKRVCRDIRNRSSHSPRPATGPSLWSPNDWPRRKVLKLAQGWSRHRDTHLLVSGNWTCCIYVFL